MLAYEIERVINFFLGFEATVLPKFICFYIFQGLLANKIASKLQNYLIAPSIL